MFRCFADFVDSFPTTSSTGTLPLCTASIQHYSAVRSPSTVYVRCTDPGQTSVYIWRCPAPLVWNQDVVGCVDQDRGELRALPELVGVLGEDALSRAQSATEVSLLAQSTPSQPDYAGIESIADVDQRTPDDYFQVPLGLQSVSTPITATPLGAGTR
jgi:hypothetical protein